jgi:hypothetical protein
MEFNGDKYMVEVEKLLIGTHHYLSNAKKSDIDKLKEEIKEINEAYLDLMIEIRIRTHEDVAHNVFEG